MKHFCDPYVKCPFYKKENLRSRKIHCEGISEGTLLQLWFESNELMKGYKKGYCKADSYSKCPLYHLIKKKYREDEDEV